MIHIVKKLRKKFMFILFHNFHSFIGYDIKFLSKESQCSLNWKSFSLFPERSNYFFIYNVSRTKYWISLNAFPIFDHNFCDKKYIFNQIITMLNVAIQKLFKVCWIFKIPSCLSRLFLVASLLHSNCEKNIFCNTQYST